MGTPELHLLTTLPYSHSVSRNFYPPLIFKFPSFLLNTTPLTSTSTIEALLDIDMSNTVHVDSELYSSVFIPGPEWETRRTRISGTGENGWYYFIFCPPSTKSAIHFAKVWGKDFTFTLRCGVYHLPDGKNPACFEKCLRFVPKTLLVQCWFEIKITPLKPFGKFRP